MYFVLGEYSDKILVLYSDVNYAGDIFPSLINQFKYKVEKYSLIISVHTRVISREEKHLETKFSYYGNKKILIDSLITVVPYGKTICSKRTQLYKIALGEEFAEQEYRIFNFNEWNSGSDQSSKVELIEETDEEMLRCHSDEVYPTDFGEDVGELMSFTIEVAFRVY